MDWVILLGCGGLIVFVISGWLYYLTSIVEEFLPDDDSTN